MANDLEQEQQSTETTDEVEEETTDTEATEKDTEETSTEESEATEQEATEDPELGKARKVAEDQRKRAEKAEAELKKLKGGKKENERVPNKDAQALSDADNERLTRAEDRAERAELRAMGVTHPDDIEYVRGAATRLGVDPAEAVSDEIVAAKLERMQAARKTKDATPAPSKRGNSGGGDNIARLADKVEKGGELPTDAATAEKVQAEIARRAQAQS